MFMPWPTGTRTILSWLFIINIVIFSFNSLPDLLPPPHCRLLRGWTAACWASLGHVTPCCWSRGRCPEMFHRPLHGTSQQMVNHWAVQVNPKFMNETDILVHTNCSKGPLWLSHLFIHSRHPKTASFSKQKIFIRVPSWKQFHQILVYLYQLCDCKSCSLYVLHSWKLAKW